MVRLPRNEKQTHRLNSRHQMGPSGLTLALTLTLNFQGQISNWLYLSQKWSDCHETKSKHIDWTLGFKWDHRVWPWPWPWPWIFKVKYEICYISTKSGSIGTRQKANISIWTLGLKFDNGFDLGHDLDIWIFKVICDLDHLVTKIRSKDLPDSDRGDFSCRRAVDSSSFQLDLSDWWLRHLLWNCPNMNATGLRWRSVNIGSGNGLVPSGNKPLPGPMLTQIYIAIWRR